MDKPQKPLNIEQAGNFLKEKKETMAADMKKEAKAAPISFASPEDRQRYLLYGISLLGDVSETAKNTWCMLTNNAPALYTTRQVAEMLRKLLVLRINGYSIKNIAYHVHTTPAVVEQVERLALSTIADLITKKQKTEIPIIGG
jgi:hypothetical protein